MPCRRRHQKRGRAAFLKACCHHSRAACARETEAPLAWQREKKSVVKKEAGNAALCARVSAAAWGSPAPGVPKKRCLASVCAACATLPAAALREDACTKEGSDAKWCCRLLSARSQLTETLLPQKTQTAKTQKQQLQKARRPLKRAERMKEEAQTYRDRVCAAAGAGASQRRTGGATSSSKQLASLLLERGPQKSTNKAAVCTGTRYTRVPMRSRGS